MKQVPIILRAPIKGLDTNWARQDQPPLTTVDCLNVWPYDRFQRARVAARPGHSRLFVQQLGGTDDVYVQAFRCSDDSLADGWVKQADVPGSLPYVYKWAGDAICYYISTDSPESTTPGLIHAIRTTMANCADSRCSDGLPCPVPPCENPPTYRQARLCADSSLADLWVNTGEISAYPYYFRFTGDNACYKVLSTETPTSSPGPVAFSASRTSISSCADASCGCVACTTFAWDTGARVEHNEPGGDPSFPMQSPTGIICTNGVTKLRWHATSDDPVFLIQSALNVTQTYSGVAGDPVTIVIPAGAIIFRNTSGEMIDDSPPQTVQKTWTDGTHSFVTPAGAVGAGVHQEVIALEGGGFTTRPWTTGVTVAELSALGWIDAAGNFSYKFVHVVSGGGFCTITDANCCDPADNVFNVGLNHTFSDPDQTCLYDGTVRELCIPVGTTLITFVNSYNDDVAIMTADSVTLTSSSTAGAGSVTITLPADANKYIIMRSNPQLGSMDGARGVIITDGTHTYTWPGSTGGQNVADCESAGFLTRHFTKDALTFTTAELEARGWLVKGKLRFKTWLLPHGAGAFFLGTLSDVHFS